MNREQCLQAWPVAIAPPADDPPMLPVLIQVPRVSVSSRPSRRIRPGSAVRPRRRLRREVRWALYGLLAVLPATASALAYRRGRQTALLEVRGPQPAATALDPVPRISISIEPAMALPPQEPEATVVFPGYLLPDDGLEEPAHAGD